jgi:divalent metal cation (Fe/Co/Zn/Cd) transporter
MVGRAAWLVFRDNIPTLIDAAVLDPARVVALAGQIAGVEVVSRVRSRGLRNAVHLDLHVAVDAQMNVLDAHHLAETIEAALRAEFPELADVVIHTGPARHTTDPDPHIHLAQCKPPS